MEAFTFVIWEGRIGGAERLSVTLASELRARGIESSVLIIGYPEQLRQQLASENVPYTYLGLRPGSRVLRHPKDFAKAVTATEASVAVLDGFGYVGAALRAGGFHGSILGVEHGVLASFRRFPFRRRMARYLDRSSGLYGNDGEVAVSEFMEKLARRTIHHPRLFRIPNGVRVPTIRPEWSERDMLTVGYAGRLYPGKGLDVVLQAMARLRPGCGKRVVLKIAGDGPIRPEMSQLAKRLAVQDRVSFVGWTTDIDAFWQSCDVAVATPDTLVESFCLSVVEAMARGKPAVVSRLGALPELVEDGLSGRIVDPGDPDAIARALMCYTDSSLVNDHGKHAHESALRRFTIDRCVDGYLAAAAGVARRR